MHPFDEASEPELQRYLNRVASVIDDCLPPETGFFAVFCPFGPNQVAQYVGNAKREDAIKWLRETADRLERNDTVSREG